DRSQGAARKQTSYYSQDEIHPHHHEIGLREVDHAHDAEDERQANAHQPVDAAEQDSTRKSLKGLFDEHAHGLTIARPSTPPSSRDSCMRGASSSRTDSVRTPRTTPRASRSRHWRSSFLVVLV